MRFSVIIPAYNAEKEIEKSIKSVLNQNYNDYEVIVIDDFSTDKTREIVKKYKDVKLINHSKNLKAGGARNTGIKNAVGDYIVFLDSDDELFSNDVLQKIEKNIKINNGPDIVYLGFLSTGNSFRGAYIPNETSSIKYNRIKDWKFAKVWDVCWKKEYLDNNNIRFVESRFFEDFLFYYEGVFKSTSYSYTDFVSIRYNSGRADSMTTNINTQKIKDFYLNLELLTDLYDGIDEEFKPIFKEIIKKENIYMNRLIDRLK